MDIKDLKVIAYTFARYSYQFDANKPCYTSKAEIYGYESNCDQAMKCLVDDNYRAVKEQAKKENWAHKYVDIDECSDESDYEIRGYDTESHDHEYEMLYRYMKYPIYYSQANNTLIYRGFVIYPTPSTRDGKLKIKYSIYNSIDNIDLDMRDTIGEVIDTINNFLSYMNIIGNDIFEEE